MKLSLEYLLERHSYWKKEIGEAGIWKVESFKDISIEIRKNHRHYNGVFQRRKIRKFLRTVIEDKIVIYNKVDDFDPVFLDSVLVHEMIHQYLIQNNLGEKRPHGKTFKEMMKAINHAFKGRLNIMIKSNNPSIQHQGPGSILHSLLFIKSDDNFYCCVVHPKKTEYFEMQLKKSPLYRHIKEYKWGESDDMYFNNFTRCMKVLHGIQVPFKDFPQFCRKYNISIKREYKRKSRFLDIFK